MERRLHGGLSFALQGVLLLVLIGNSSAGQIDIVAVQSTVNISNSVSYDTFAAQYEQLVESINTTNTTLIVFGEMVALPAAFLGTRGAKARALNQNPNATLEESMLTLATSYAVPMALYAEQFKGEGLSIANYLELALVDVMWRAFFTTFSTIAQQKQSYVIACTLAPQIKESTNWVDIKLFGDPDIPNQKSVFMAVNSSVFNTAFVFDPTGTIVHSVSKHFLTEEEIDFLNLTPAPIENNLAFDLPGMGRLCIAICYDAFYQQIIQPLDEQGCVTLIQPSYNTGIWPSYENLYWQPDDWQHSTWGSIQSQYLNILYNVNVMIVGNLFDSYADGQTSIHMKSNQPPPLGGDLVYIGADNVNSNYTGTSLAVAPWVIPDPGIANPQLSLDQRRYILQEKGLELVVTNDYVVTIVTQTLWV